MSDLPEPASAERPKIFVNLGSGPKGGARLPALFGDWRELRIDVDPRVNPDLVADITDLSAIENSSVDAVWASHCLEHVYLHQVGTAIREVYRVLREDGFFCMIVPDLQAIAEFIATDRLHEVIYQSPAGPVTAHDMLYGFGAFIAQGRISMGHKCGFTPTLLLHALREAAPFAEIVLHRRPGHELAAIACKHPIGEEHRDALVASLGI